MRGTLALGFESDSRPRRRQGQMTDGSDIWGPSVEMAQGLDLNLIFAEQVMS